MRATRFQLILACLLLFAVAVVLVAPSVHLDPTTLGSQQAATIAMSAALAAGSAWAAILVASWALSGPPAPDSAIVPLASVLDLICTRLC